MTKKLISFDYEADGHGLPAQVVDRLDDRYMSGTGEGGLIAPSDTTFFEPSTNLFDKTKITENMVIPSGTADLNPSANFNVSDPIPVTAGQVYSYAGILRVTYLDSSGGYVDTTNLPDPETFSGTYTAPSGATHARLSVSLHDDWMDTAQMNSGSTLLPYEPGGSTKIAPQYLPETTLTINE